MKTANLLPSVVFYFGLFACTWACVSFVKKTHKPEVEGSSPSLDTTYIKQSQNIINTTYTAFVGYWFSLFLIQKQGVVALALFLFSSKNSVFVEFYCRVTAELISLPFYLQSNIYEHPT